MDSLIIEGGSRLRGTLKVNGSKNAALPLMAAALLADGPTYLKDVPNLSDINHQINLLRELGCTVEREAGGELKMEVVDEKNSHARYDLVRKMRASICVLGPLLAKRKFAADFDAGWMCDRGSAGGYSFARVGGAGGGD